MRTLGYLTACAVGGAIVGRGFGEFSRARFHYPLRLDAAPQWQQVVVRALDAIEWPSLFGLTLAVSLGLWIWLRPRSAAPARSRAWGGTLVGLSSAVAVLLVVPVTNPPGVALAAVIAGLIGAVVGARLLAFWREASTETRSSRQRWVRQLPLAAGQLAATSAAALSLGYRGESALIHGIALLVGVGILVVEVALTVVIAVLATRVSSRR